MIERVPIGIDNEEVFSIDALNRKSGEFALVCKSGNVYLFDQLSCLSKLIGKLNFPVKYSEDYFTYAELIGDKKELLQITSYGNYVGITQKYGLSGVVLNLENFQFNKKLQRGNYQVEHCTFPIAFFSAENSTYLIHGTDWNRLDITHLESDKLITERVVDYETHSNYFDYFHSSLSVSPDSKYFTSNGWHWGPCDVITAYSIEEFLTRFELAHIALNYGPVDGYNWDRPMGWIDNRTVVIGYNKQEENEGEGGFPSEIVFVDAPLNEIEIKFRLMASRFLTTAPQRGSFTMTTKSSGSLV